MNLRIRTALMFALVGFAGLAATGCNTIEGAGKDLEKAGEEVQDAADDARG